jgi:outer membrane lipoprotein-sorting protein
MRVLYGSKLGQLLFLLSGVYCFASADPNALLKKADSFRNPSESYEMTIKVKTPDTETTFDVYLKGTSKTLIVTKEPARDRGRNMLMLDRDFYSYVPNLKRSVRLSLAQKFSGQVANGDIARTRWFGDYKPTIEKQNPKETILLLDGVKNNLTYQKIRLWVDSATAKPLHAEYLNLDGRTILKRAWFENYRNMAGGIRPTLMRIEDTNHQSSTLSILSMEPKGIDDGIFTETNMEAQQ